MSGAFNSLLIRTGCELTNGQMQSQIGPFHGVNSQIRKFANRGSLQCNVAQHYVNKPLIPDGFLRIPYLLGEFANLRICLTPPLAAG
jgi:hypothetical protein